MTAPVTPTEYIYLSPEQVNLLNNYSAWAREVGLAGIIENLYQGQSETIDDISAAGAISLDTTITEITSDAVGLALTLADGVEGQRKILVYSAEDAGGDSAVVTPANLAGAATTITFAAVGDIADLVFVGGTWYATVRGAVVA